MICLETIIRKIDGWRKGNKNQQPNFFEKSFLNVACLANWRQEQLVEGKFEKNGVQHSRRHQTDFSIYKFFFIVWLKYILHDMEQEIRKSSDRELSTQCRASEYVASESVLRHELSSLFLAWLNFAIEKCQQCCIYQAWCYATSVSTPSKMECFSMESECSFSSSKDERNFEE